MTRNADLQTTAFLKEGISDWHILELVWPGLAKEGRTMYFGAFLKGVGLRGRN